MVFFAWNNILLRCRSSTHTGDVALRKTKEPDENCQTEFSLKENWKAWNRTGRETVNFPVLCVLISSIPSSAASHLKACIRHLNLWATPRHQFTKQQRQCRDHFRHEVSRNTSCILGRDRKVARKAPESCRYSMNRRKPCRSFWNKKTNLFPNTPVFKLLEENLLF